MPELRPAAGRALKAAAFAGLAVWFPCPWYLVAVGGLLPLPVIVWYGFAGGVILVFSLVHLAVYGTIFFLAVRKIQRPVTAALVLAGALAISFAPIYGSGENLAAGGKLNRNAWQVYAEEFRR